MNKGDIGAIKHDIARMTMPAFIISCWPQRMINFPVRPDKPNIPIAWAIITKEIVQVPWLWWFICTGVITIISVIINWPMTIETIPYWTWAFWSISLTLRGDTLWESGSAEILIAWEIVNGSGRINKTVSRIATMLNPALTINGPDING